MNECNLGNCYLISNNETISFSEFGVLCVVVSLDNYKTLIEAMKRIRDNANTIGYLPESHFVSNNSVAIFNSNDIARTALKKVGIE